MGRSKKKMATVNGTSKGIKSIEFNVENGAVKMTCKHAKPMRWGMRKIDEVIPTACLCCDFKDRTTCCLPYAAQEIKNEHVFCNNNAYKITELDVKKVPYFTHFGSKIRMIDAEDININREYRFASSASYPVDFCIHVSNNDCKSGSTYLVSEDALIDRSEEEIKGGLSAKKPKNRAIAIKVITSELDYEIILVSSEEFKMAGVREEATLWYMCATAKWTGKRKDLHSKYIRENKSEYIAQILSARRHQREESFS
jgi:hypothetical protein